MKKIRAKALFVPFFASFRLVAATTHAHIHLLRPSTADRLERPLLQHAQQLRLQVERQLADLIEKNGPSIRQRKPPIALRRRPGERALLMSEKFAFSQRRRDCPAINWHKRSPAAFAIKPVQCTRKQLLAVPVSPWISTVASVAATCLHLLEHMPERLALPEDIRALQLRSSPRKYSASASSE